MPFGTFQDICPMLDIIVDVGEESIDWCFQKYDSRAGDIAQVGQHSPEHGEYWIRSAE